MQILLFHTPSSVCSSTISPYAGELSVLILLLTSWSVEFQSERQCSKCAVVENMNIILLQYGEPISEAVFSRGTVQ